MDLNGKLIGDLGRLAAKYPSDDWRALLSALNDKESRDQVAALLEELISSSSRQGTRTVKQSSILPDLRERLEHLNKSEPDRARILNDLWLRLRSKELLPDMPSVRSFAENIGIKELTVKKREQAVPAIVLHLARLAQSDFDSTLASALGGRNADIDEDYGRWVEMILGSGPSGTDGVPDEGRAGSKKSFPGGL
jgi:CDP-glycerol glycerophosphotransferase (TagB/SpsB family)